MMSKLLERASILALSALLCSCSTDVITLDLDTADPRIVIEGKVTEGPGPQTVRITMTTDFFEPGDYPPVTGAAVTIADDTGAEAALVETGPGLYSTSSLAGIPGRTYTLTVETESAVYSAVSTMQSPSRIDSLSFEVDDESEDMYIVHCHFTDTIDLKEYFRFKLFINGGQYHDYFMYQDRLTDGNAVEYEFYIEKEISDGDVIAVEMQALDRPAYEYFNTLQNALIGSADDEFSISTNSPANPESNLSNAALGYFSAFSASAESLVVRK